MNDICEMWNLPWHALQKDLASGLPRNAAGHFTPALKSLSVETVAVSANSWLSRARHRTAAPTQAQ